MRILALLAVLAAAIALPSVADASTPALTCAIAKTGCTTVNGGLVIRGASNLTINAKGAQLTQKSAKGAPMLELIGDKNLTIENLVLDGARTSADPGGVGDEADYGVEFQGDAGVTFKNLTVENTLGDWVYLAPPYAINGSSALNTGITITTSTFTNAGYHGFTVESVGCPTSKACNGLSITHSTMTNMAVDAMDFEYDDYSTGFSNGLPQQAAEDHITISDNTWSAWSDDWLASIQGQIPGVQEQRVTLSNNTLDADAPLFEVVGTPTSSTTPPYLNAYFTITGNAFGAGYYATGYHGGTSATGQLYSIAGLVMERNTFPVCQTAIYCGSNPHQFTPNRFMFDIYNTSYSVIEHNTFAGAAGVVLPQGYNEQDAHLLTCENAYGADATLLDAPACQY